MDISLQDKFYGCICGSHIGSAMGAVVEGEPFERTEARFGTLDKLLPYEHYDNGWMCEAGTTEDGIERQKMIITAMIEKQDRVNAEDVRSIWLRDMNPRAPGNVSEPFEATLLAMAKAGIPARDIGKYCDYSNLVSFARACHPIGLINAGDEKAAKEDVMEVGQLYQGTNSKGLKWACVTAVAIAAATRPHATVDSVIQAIFDHCNERQVVEGRDDWYPRWAGLDIAEEIENALTATKHCKNFRELRTELNKIYFAYGIPYSQAFANEIVTKAICVFKMVGGDVKEAIIAAVNLGRDTDCAAAVAAGIAGALTGTETLPKEWISQVDYATTLNPYTNSKRTLKETSDGLFEAYKTRYRRAIALAEYMGLQK